MNNVVTNIRFVALLAVLALTACTREDLTSPSAPIDEGELVETTLSLTTADVQVIGAPMNPDAGDVPYASQTRTASNADALEKQINDIWVFQFDAQGSKQLTAPRYYDNLTTDSEGKTPFSIMLRPYTNSLLYLVANTNNATWAKNMTSYTVAQLNQQTFTYTSETDLYDGGLPMVAQRSNTTIAAGTDNSLGDIKLKSLVAKLRFSYKLAESIKGQMQVTKVQLFNIPDRVQLGHAFSQPTGTYPAAGEFTSISGNYAVAPALAEGNTYTWYVPQTLQGTVSNSNEAMKNALAPQNALYIAISVDSEMDGSSYDYTLYPGGNTTNDFNLKNGNCYNIVMTLNSEKTDDRVLASPANCFVTKTGATLRFDPYVRNEKDQGVDILKYANYVNKTNKRIAKVDILWQTGDGTHFAIGNNSKGDRVKIENDIITVETGDAEGNAVIAGYDSNGTILWSWHIWVNNSSPAQLSRAVPYTTYQWDKTGIHTELPRVKRQSVMTCNLGALADEPGNNPQNTYGLWYQWGRKDPFPSGNMSAHHTSYPYSNDYIIATYNAKCQQIIMTDPMTESSNFFRAIPTSSTTGTISYVIQHPTHFITSTATENYDWYYGHEDRLWGGKPFSEASKVFQTPQGGYLSDNGATEKSIFDPCPAGWMMPPTDMWAGFTTTGMTLYDATFQKINCTESSITESRKNRGYHMYMDGAKWKDDVTKLKTAFFPAAGLLDYNARPTRNGTCGNYFTSTASEDGYSSIFHMHVSTETVADDRTAQVNLYGAPGGDVKRGRGCAIRCVRESE